MDPLSPTSLLGKSCVVCKKFFVKPPSCGVPEWNKKRKVCSRLCADIWKRGQHFSPKSEFKNGHPFGKRFQKGQRPSPETEFKLGQSVWNKGRPWTEEEKRRMNLGHWKNKFGEGTPNWQGGRTRLQASIRSCGKYIRWRNRVFIRDNWKCTWCGKGGKIHADHITPFSFILRRYNIRTLEQALSCKMLWKTRNGRTLCEKCHETTESYKGKSNQYSKIKSSNLTAKADSGSRD